MSDQVLGNMPGLRRLSLIDGQDFIYTFTVVDRLPLDAVVTLDLLNHDRSTLYGSWPVTALTVRIDAADHAVAPDGSWFRLWVTFPDDGGRFCCLAGPVERNRL